MTAGIKELRAEYRKNGLTPQLLDKAAKMMVSDVTKEADKLHKKMQAEARREEASRRKSPWFQQLEKVKKDMRKKEKRKEG